VQDWSGYIGSWDNRVFAGVVPERTFSVNNPLERIATGYIKRDPLAWFCSHRHQRLGNDEVYKYTYLFKYALELPAGAKKLKLPDNPRLRIFAVTAAQNENDAVVPLQPLYDDFSGRESVKLRKVE
jgi:alpha-mannosidase